MIRTIEATIDEQGTVLLQESVALTAPHRALVTILDEEPRTARPPRQGWKEHFKQIVEAGEDRLLDSDALTSTPTRRETKAREW